MDRTRQNRTECGRIEEDRTLLDWTGHTQTNRVGLDSTRLDRTGKDRAAQIAKKKEWI